MTDDRPWRLLWRKGGGKWREYDRYFDDTAAWVAAARLRADTGWSSEFDIDVKKMGPAENDQPPAPDVTSHTMTPPLRRP